MLTIRSGFETERSVVDDFGEETVEVWVAPGSVAVPALQEELPRGSSDEEWEECDGRVDLPPPNRWEETYDYAQHRLRESIARQAETARSINPNDPPVLVFLGHIGLLSDTIAVHSAATDVRKWIKIAFPNRERTPTKREIIEHAKRLIFF